MKFLWFLEGVIVGVALYCGVRGWLLYRETRRIQKITLESLERLEQRVDRLCLTVWPPLARRTEEPKR